MKLGSIPDPFAGEKVADIFPRISPYVLEKNRLGRLHYFPGRHLTQCNLVDEQTIRDTRLTLRGQAVTSGIVRGLEVAWRDVRGEVEIIVQPGQAILDSGADVVVDRTIAARLDDVALPAPNPPGAPTTAYAGVLILQTGRTRDDDLPAAMQVEDYGPDYSPAPRSVADEVYYPTTYSDAARLALYILPQQELDGPAWRNRLAWELFGLEAKNDERPWLELGVPLALIAFNRQRRPLFIDRHAVARPGGRPRQRVLAFPELDARAWMARFDQFCAHLGELTEVGPALAEFHYLPPVGLLPKACFDLGEAVPPTDTTRGRWQSTQSFFPANYTVDVTVIPTEQLDALIASHRSLAPYEVGQADSVRLLLPVSQQWFDPDLLAIEGLDPRFAAAVSAFRDARARWLAQRYDLARRRRALEESIDGNYTPYPMEETMPDPKRLEDPELRGDQATADAPPEPADQYETTRTRVRERLFSTIEVHATPFSMERRVDGPLGAENVVKRGGGAAPEMAAGSAGLVERLKYTSNILERIRAEADNFIKEFTPDDIKEFVQLFTACGLPGNTDQAKKDREDVSKWLNKTNWSETGDDTALTDAEKEELRRELIAYIRKQIGIQDEEDKKASTYNLQQLIDFFEAKADEADELVESGFLKVRADVYRLGQLLNNNSLGTKFAASPTLANIIERKPAKSDTAAVNNFASQLAANFAPSKVGSAVQEGLSSALTNFSSGGSPTTGADLPAGALNAISELRKLSTFAGSYVENFNQLSHKQIRAIPLDQLQPALAPAVRKEIHDGRLEVFERLTRLNLSLGDLTTDFVDSPDHIVRPEGKPITRLARLRFHSLIARRFDSVSRITFKEHTTAATVVEADESKHFSSGVSYADMAQAALRAVEQRIKEYRAFVALCRAALKQTQALIKDLTTALVPVELELDEARQDVAVALALLAEEDARRQAVNAHREKILREHVEFLVYHRPRALSAITPVASRPLEDALLTDPVLDCFRLNPPVPPDLAALREPFRASPAKWLVHAPKWLEKVSLWEHMRALLERSHRLPPPLFSPAISFTPGRYQGALDIVYKSRQSAAERHFATFKIAAPALLPTYSWLDLKREAESKLTLDHLLTAGPASLARAAAEELDHIFTVATCLHDNFSHVPGLVRLSWAERFSQFDRVNVDFRDLSRLPNWHRLDFNLQRELRILTEWLYGRVDPKVPDALELIHDLVRVALLLASHAPVDQLIIGQPLEENIRPELGGFIKLKVDPLRIRQGMTVTHQVSSTQIIQAVVEDISASHVSARIIQVPAGSFANLGPGSSFYFK